MSELFQAGQHPDADQLNAFVEHTLPAHEQQQTLAHLALCPHCRQIVALSLPPGDESPMLPPEPVRHRWWAWAGIPALAAIVLVIFFVRHEQRNVRYTSVLSQMAAAGKPAPPQAEIPPPESLRSIAPMTEHLMMRRPNPPAPQPTPPAQASPGTASGVAGGVMGGIARRQRSPTTCTGTLLCRRIGRRQGAYERARSESRSSYFRRPASSAQSSRHALHGLARQPEARHRHG